MNYDDYDLHADTEQGACSDIGNALRLGQRFEDDLRFVPTHGWYRYEGYRLVRLEGSPLDEATALPSLIRKEAEPLPDGDRRKELLKWADKSASASRLREALAIMSDFPFIRTNHDQLDVDPHVVNTPQGAFHLKLNDFRETLASDLLTKGTKVRPAPPQQGAVFSRFLTQILPSADSRTFLKRAVGYSLTGLTREEVFFILHGTGQNGKSKLLSAIAHALGDYAHNFDPKLVVQQKYEGHPTNIASLSGVRFAYSSEVGEEMHLDEGRVKALTGGDAITARLMRKDEFTFSPTHKLWLATNHLPLIKGTDKGMWRRIMVIPFDVSIPDDQRDNLLEEKLHAEAGSILAWAIDGAQEYLEYGLDAPAEVVMASAHYKQEQDSVGRFLAECTTPNTNGEVPAGDLYKSYKDWTTDNGFKVMTSTAFGREMTSRGYEQRATNSRKLRLGLTLNERMWV